MSENMEISGMVHPQESGEDTLRDKYVSFELGEDQFAIEIRDVSEIIGLHKITPLPDVPPYILGVINLRGKVVSVMDMRMRLGMEDRDYDKRSCIIVINHRNVLTGLVVDRVREVVNIPAEDVESTSGTHGVLVHEFIRGMCKVGEDVKVILDVENVLGAEFFKGFDQD